MFYRLKFSNFTESVVQPVIRYMKNPVRFCVSMLCVAVMMSMISCRDSNHDLIRRAERVVTERPDSAFLILKKVEFNRLTDIADKAAYALNHARANLSLDRSLVADTLLDYAIDYYRSAGDTAAYVEAAVAQAHHLRARERKSEAFGMMDSLVSAMPAEIQRQLNQELLGFSFADKDFDMSIRLIDRQIDLAETAEERLDFEVKKITPLLSLGRDREALRLCDSLFALPESPGVGTRDWLYMRINYAAVLGERRETAPQAVEILNDVIERIKGHAPDEKLMEFYIPMVNLQLNAGNLGEARRYAALADGAAVDLLDRDPVALTYLEFLKIVLDYEHSGALSLSRISNIAQSLWRVNNDLEIKRRERDDAIETAYDLSRNNYELTIRHQRLLLLVAVIALAGMVVVGTVYLVSHRRRQKLIEAEERIEALEQLVKSADTASTDDRQGLLKRLLLQQLGIIRTFAESPTAQNMDALKKISRISDSAAEEGDLVNWADLYPVIDELYDNFHANLTADFPDLFSDREIRILCLLRADFSTKEIGVLIGQTSNSVYVSKTAIRKKLGLQAKEDFISYLIQRNYARGEA